ncbi:MAG: gfo/Idh/MocA family oxidoreductase [Planctomycetes bacterium]|nr:gfo/Idh/MocA family oxidoreductase [Planctomycetota bacterium]
MSAQQDNQEFSTSRREFLRQSSSVLAGTTLANAVNVRAFAGESNTIQIALVGCGGRGTGAAENALSTEGPVKLVAMADAFEDRLQASLRSLAGKFGKQVDVPKDRQFLGLDGFKKAIDVIAPGGVALLATPPAFRPIHVEYAVAKDCHVFMEKAFAVDAPGVRRILKAGQEAKKNNLKIAGGLMSRHSKPLAEAIDQLHQGRIGNLITLWAYREHGVVPFSNKRAGENELAHQIRNFHCFTWLNGSFLLDWLIHNLDVCCWCKDAWPAEAQGQGGRQTRTNPDQLFDHYAVEYHFADGTRLFAQGRHIDNCWGFFGDIIHGARGSAVLGEGVSNPRLFKGYAQKPEDVIWQYKGPPCNQYQVEHDLLFDAIRQDRPYNESERCAYAALVGILGRMAAESGQLVKWNEALTSNLELAPGLDNYTMTSNPPVMPDSKGNYPIAMPGATKVL